MTKNGENAMYGMESLNADLKIDEPVANVTEMKIIFEEALAAVAVAALPVQS